MEKRLIRPVTLAFVALSLLLSEYGSSPLSAKRISIGEPMVEFRLPKAGTSEASQSPAFVYRHDQARPLILVFLGVGQERSQRAIDDIHSTLEAFQSQRSAFDVLGIYSLPSNPASPLPSEMPTRAFPIVVDRGYVLWGQLGVIVTPTAMVVGADHTIKWIQPGHGYDFAAGLRRHLALVLGLAPASPRQQGDTVRVLSYRTNDAVVMRHVRLAAQLCRKGKPQVALQELQKALAKDPNHVEASLLLGELHCRAGDSQDAMKVVQGIQCGDALSQARRSMILGWAHRQLNQMDRAEALLLTATTLDPTSSRAFFELGQVYEAQAASDKALRAYRQALALVFDQEGPIPNSRKQ